MKTAIAAVLAVLALAGCVAVPYGPGPGVYVTPAPAYYYGGHVPRHYYHRHHYHHYR